MVRILHRGLSALAGEEGDDCSEAVSSSDLADFSAATVHSGLGDGPLVPLEPACVGCTRSQQDRMSFTAAEEQERFPHRGPPCHSPDMILHSPSSCCACAGLGVRLRQASARGGYYLVVWPTAMARQVKNVL